MFAIGSILPSFFLDRFGRRKIVFIGCAILGLSMMLIAILLSFQGTKIEKPAAAASVAFFFVVGFYDLQVFMC